MVFKRQIDQGHLPKYLFQQDGNRRKLLLPPLFPDGASVGLVVCSSARRLPKGQYYGDWQITLIDLKCSVRKQERDIARLTLCSTSGS